MSEHQYLHGVEGLLDELFSQRSSNERKREIEQTLGQFEQQSESWRYCLYFLKQSNNQFVLMFSLKVLEDLVNKMWASVTDKDQMEARQFLFSFVLYSHGSASVETYIQKKAVKVMVDIGRADWPHRYPDFFHTIIELIQDPTKCRLGLVMALTASQELATPREDLSMARKEELHKLLLDMVPQLLAVTLSVLETIADRQRQTVSETPPSSPLRQRPVASHASPMKSLQVPLQAIQHKRSPPHHHAPLDVQSEELSRLALQCLVHVFSWAPLSTALSPNLLTIVFHFAGVGCEIGADARIMSCTELGGLALSCINELVSKHQVPSQFDDFLMTLFVQISNLLERITDEVLPGANAAGQTENLLSHLEDSYLEKFTELLRVFIGNHFRRIEASCLLPTHNFLFLLYKYTFKQPQLDGFFVCMECWDTFLDYLIGKVAGPSQQTAMAGIQGQYKEVALPLVERLLQKAQFRHNRSELLQMESDDEDDDETEWVRFLSRILETSAKVAELYPSEIIHMMLSLFVTNVAVHEGIHRLVVPGETGSKLNVVDFKDAEQLHTALRDLTTSIQALGMLADHFIGDQFVQRFDQAYAMVDKLCKVVLYSTEHKLFSLTAQASDMLVPVIQDVHAHGLSTLQAYCHWVAQFYVETVRHQEHQEKFGNLLVQMVDAVTSVLGQVALDKIHLAASRLLVSLCSTVRPQYLLALKPMQSLLSSTSAGALAALPHQAQLLVFRGLSSALVLPWPEVPDSEQQWDARVSEHNKLLQSLSWQFCQISHAHGFADDAALQESVKPYIKRTLAILTELLDEVRHQGTKSKLVVYQAVQDPVEVSLKLFPIYIQQPDVIDSIMTFLVALCDSLKVQVGPQFIERTIQTIMGLFTSEQMRETVIQESQAGCRVIERFLHLLQVVVQELGSAFKAFLPNIIAFCLEQMHPVVADRDVPDVKSVMFELLQDVLINHWRHFFPSSVLQKVGSSVSEEPVNNEDQFMTMMKAIGESFLQPDIALFKQNLAALENVNTKWRLYQKRVVRGGLLPQLLSVLLRVLVNKSHDLLREEITLALHNMAAVDFEDFYGNFLPQFLGTGFAGLTDDQREKLAREVDMHKDLPSFIGMIHRLTSDIRYYLISNSSLPAGSVRL